MYVGDEQQAGHHDAFLLSFFILLYFYFILLVIYYCFSHFRIFGLLGLFEKSPGETSVCRWHASERSLGAAMPESIVWSFGCPWSR